MIYIGNGHAAWEASLVNVFSRGERALALVTGRFGLAWARMGAALGIEMETLDFGTDSPADPARVESALRADTQRRIRAVTTVLTDTATGVRNDVAALRAAIDAADHPALLMVDAICSFGCEPFDMDGWGVDVMVTGSQKGLMTPPGLAFVFAGPRALEPRGTRDLVTPYWDWTPAPELLDVSRTLLRHAADAPTCSACARRWTCCSRKASSRSGHGTARSPEPSGRRLGRGAHAAPSPATCPSPRTAPSP